jgi:hypothetical protein
MYCDVINIFQFAKILPPLPSDSVIMDKIQCLTTTSNFQEINSLFLTMYHATQLVPLYQQDVTNNFRHNVLYMVLVSIQGLDMSMSNTTTSIP